MTALTPRTASSDVMIVSTIAVLSGVAGVWFGPLYVLPVIAIAAWYAIGRIAVTPVVLALWAAVFSLFGDKMVLRTAIGDGVGLLRLGPLLTVTLFAAMLIIDRETRKATEDVVRLGAPASLFITLGALLPFLGLFVDYPPHTVAAAMTPLATGAFLVFGVLVARSGIDVDRVRFITLSTITTIAAIAGLLLFLHNHGLVLPLARAIDNWGVSTAEAYGTVWLRGRVGGLYTNPNIFGTLGGLALIYAALCRLTLRQRIALILPGITILYVTQSRGVMAGTIAAILVVFFAQWIRRHELKWRTLMSWVLILVILGVALAEAVALFPQHLGTLTARIASALRVLIEGAQADVNFAGRVAIWTEGWELLTTHVLGTFGPPEQVVGTGIDNDYLRFALQGGFPYAGAWILYLLWLMYTGLRKDMDRFIAAGAIFIAITAFTQIPSAYVMVIGIFSLFVGMHIEKIRISSLPTVKSTLTIKKAGDR